MSQLSIETNVSEIVKEVPQTGDLFRQLRIDFCCCCGGKVSLRTAAIDQKLDPDEVLEKVKSIQPKQTEYQQTLPSSLDE